MILAFNKKIAPFSPLGQKICKSIYLIEKNYNYSHLSLEVEVKIATLSDIYNSNFARTRRDQTLPFSDWLEMT